jgi:hypothetical protein
MPDETPSSSSWDQLLPHSLCHGVRPVANAELSLHLLEVTTHGLFTKTKYLGDLIGPSPHRHQTQDGEFAGGDASSFSHPSGIVVYQLFKA